MKSIIALFILSAQLFALTIALNSGEENKKHYAILHIMDTEPFSCEKRVEASQKEPYTCITKKPSTKLIETKKTRYATIDFKEKEDAFLIDITPQITSRLIPIEETLHETKELLGKAKQKQYRHWIIVFEEESLYKEHTLQEGLSFPIPFEKHQYPYVGALDLNGMPISYAQTKDIELYLEIKRLYENRTDYPKVIKESQYLLSTFPHSLFRSDAELFILRSMDKLLGNQEKNSKDLVSEEALVSRAKEWMKTFTSDEGLPEVLMLMVKSYLALGLKADSNYYMDILINEHPKSPYTKRAMLLFADALFAQKEKEKAMNLYVDVLYGTKDLDIASEAAIRLSERYMDGGKAQEAKEYLLKVLNANQEYLLKNKEASLALAGRLYEHKLYDLAARVQEVLLEHVDTSDEHKEALLKQTGDTYAKAGMIDKAYQRYERYLHDYPNGLFVEDVKTSLDELFFQKEETNATQAYYDALIKQYANMPIGQKALEKKAQLLFQQKRFQEILDLESALLMLPHINHVTPEGFIYEAAQASALEALSHNECSRVANLAQTYKLHFPPQTDDAKLFSCFMRASHYAKAQEIATNHLKENSLESRFTWMQHVLEATFKQAPYKVIDISLEEDLQTLSKNVKQPMMLETLRILALNALNTKALQKALGYVAEIEKHYPDMPSTLDVYAMLIRLASDQKDDLVVVGFAKKMVELQKKFHSTLYSPWVELIFIDALKRLGRDKEAYNLVASLEENNTLKPEELVRILYHGGELSLKLKENQKAKAYFQKCIQVKEVTPWRAICEENLKLL